jgi:hypothetical protein
MSSAIIAVRVTLVIRKRGGRKLVVLPDGAIQAASAPVVSTRADPALVKALARAFRWQKLLDEGRYASITEMAAAEKIERGFLGKVLQLTLLAPELVEAMLDGTAPPSVTLPALMQQVPAAWSSQRKAVQFQSAPSTSTAYARRRDPPPPPGGSPSATP